MTGLEITVTHLIIGILGTIATAGITTWKFIVSPWMAERKDTASWRKEMEIRIGMLEKRTDDQIREIRNDIKEVKSCLTEVKAALARLEERSHHK